MRPLVGDDLIFWEIEPTAANARERGDSDERSPVAPREERETAAAFAASGCGRRRRARGCSRHAGFLHGIGRRASRYLLRW